MTKSPRAIFAQSGNDLDFVSEEVVAITTHILRDGNSDVAIRGLATPPIVANRVANGKPLVRRSGILHPMDLWRRPEAVEFSAPSIEDPQAKRAAKKLLLCHSERSEESHFDLSIREETKRDSSLRSE